jgi:hypothetical protein
LVERGNKHATGRVVREADTVAQHVDWAGGTDSNATRRRGRACKHNLAVSNYKHNLAKAAKLCL